MSPGEDGGDQTRLSFQRPDGGRAVSAPGRAHPEDTRGWPVPPIRPGGPFALPLPLPAGGGAGARRPGAPPPPPRQAEAARWRRQRQRRQPGGRGRSAQLAASLLPRETEGTLSRAAAPRPVDSPWLGHGGTQQQRAREVGECEAAGGKRPRRSEEPEGRSEGTAVGGGWPKADGGLGSAVTARVFPAGRGGEGEGD